MNPLDFVERLFSSIGSIFSRIGSLYAQGADTAKKRRAMRGGPHRRSTRYFQSDGGRKSRVFAQAQRGSGRQDTHEKVVALLIYQA